MMAEQQTNLPPGVFETLGRRIRGLAMISRGIVPNLVISQRVVQRVMEAARHHLADETGEAMVGMVLEPDGSDPEAMPTLVVLETIAPDESSIRRSHMFEQGDDLQGDIMVWLQENWRAYRQMGKDMHQKPIKPEWQVPLRHLGDWHKQPGFMIQPSGGDLMTAIQTLEDDENLFEFLLVPIVTLGHPTVTLEAGTSVNYFTVPQEDGTSLRMDWWYIHRDSRFFQPITPTVVPQEHLPPLTPYPWHIIQTDLMNDEIELLDGAGYFLLNSSSILWNTDDDLPLEICFIIGKPGWGDVYLVATDWDYPQKPPRARRAPFKGINAQMHIYDIFKQLWASSTPVSAPADFTWTSETFIIDFVQAIDGGSRATPATASASDA